ncbi:MAG: PDZ domain-containing protein [Nitriliruptoraceae bacterium]
MRRSADRPESANAEVIPAGSAPARRWGLRRVATAITVVVAMALAAAFVRGDVPCDVVRTQPSCYLAIGPGPVVDTFTVISVEGAPVSASSGELLLTTIVVTDRLNAAQWWRAVTSSSVDTAPRDVLFPDGQDTTEVRRRNAIAMQDSQLEATIAALDHLGYELVPDGARIAMVLDDAQTDLLEVGDIVTAVDATRVESSAQLSELIGARAPGTAAVFEVRRDGSDMRLEVTLGATPDDPSRGRVGVLAITEIRLPIDVTIDAGDVGGPSAGMMFALAIIDLLSPDDLAAGHIIAGTGVVARDGTVRSVGGVRQKLAAATGRQPAAELFLVPRGNLADARRAEVGSEVLVVPIDTLADAVNALDALARGHQPADSVMLTPR